MPAAIARFRPSPVRSRISSRPNSAMEAKSVESKRPCADEVSQSGSPSERNEAPALPAMRGSRPATKIWPARLTRSRLLALARSTVRRSAALALIGRNSRSLWPSLEPAMSSVVSKLDRLGRSTRELLDLIDRIGSNGAFEPYHYPALKRSDAHTPSEVVAANRGYCTDTDTGSTQRARDWGLGAIRSVMYVFKRKVS
jgi:hypothetical protein